MTEKYLITGADGFIGSHLLEYLLSLKIPPQNIRLLLKNKKIINPLPNKPFDITYADIRNKAAVIKATKGINVIYHLAALTSFEAKTYKGFKAVNVDGVAYLLEGAKKEKINKFVFFSTIAVYGLPAWSGDIKNYDENHDQTYSDPYGQSKHEAEKLIVAAHKKWHIPYAIVRPTSVYGPRDKGQLFELYRAIKQKKFFMIGSGENKMHFVYVKDLVKGTRQMQTSKKQALDCILGGERPLKFNEIVKYVGKSINVEPHTFKIPKSMGLAAGYSMEWVGHIFSFRSPLFPSRVRVMTRNYYYKIDKAKKEIGYQPSTSFQKGTQITGRWLIENDLL